MRKHPARVEVVVFSDIGGFHHLVKTSFGYNTWMQTNRPSTAAKKSTASYYAAFLAMGISMSVVGPTLPGLAASTHATLSAIGLLFTVRSLGSLAASVVGGSIYDKVKGHGVMGLMIVLSAVFCALVPFVPSLWLLIGLMFLTGAAQGLMNIGGNTLIVWTHGKSVGPFMNGLHFCFGLGTFLTPILVAQFITRPGGLTTTYLLAAVLILPTALVALLPSPSQPAVTKTQNGGRIDIWLVVLISLVFGTYSGASTAFGGWITTYTLKMGLGDAALGSYLASVFWGAFTIARLVAIPLARRFTPAAILAADFAGALFSLVAMMIWPASLVAVIITSAGFGFALASIYPTTMSLASQLMPISGRITGLFSIGNSIGMMIIPWAIGLVFESAPVNMAWVLAVDMVVALGVLVLLSQWHRQQAARQAI